MVPHLGLATVETRTAMAVRAADNALAMLHGEQPPTPIGYRSYHPATRIRAPSPRTGSYALTAED